MFFTSGKYDFTDRDRCDPDYTLGVARKVNIKIIFIYGECLDRYVIGLVPLNICNNTLRL